MRFGSFPVTEAEGMVLAHSVRTGAKIFKKGRVLSGEDIEALSYAGVSTVYAAHLGIEDTQEDEAAATIAAALTGPNTRADTAFTGRANLYATAPGILRLNESTINEINALDEAITVATLPNFEVISEGQMLATVKIIPYAAPKQLVEHAASLATGTSPTLELHPFKLKRAALILTSVEGTKQSILGKSETVIRARLGSLGASLFSVQTCRHDEASLIGALQAVPDGVEMILVLGASATGDRRDVVPASIEKSGGVIQHFGMPVDPGNLLLLAELKGRPVIGLPGCARSPKLNGADWVLQRLVAGLTVEPHDIQSMGVGGLLKEIPSRPQPRDAERPSDHLPRVAAIILGGGRSTRMGTVNKLTSDFEGKPMIAHVADAALASKADGIILVTGHEKEDVLKALAGRPMSYAHNPDYADGLSTSIKAGIEAATELDPPVNAAVILLGDMPLITADLIDRLINARDPAEEKLICVPVVGKKRGNPVLWDASFFSDLLNLSGDVGAKALMAQNSDLVCEVPVDGEGPLTDFDTPDALHQYQPD
jgi:molybdenum cofactor cytidylyltransferase|tara:strand:+ start:7387 stop:9006 length:1620 start_codon:yes stop_codon:yes gene_type:complete